MESLTYLLPLTLSTDVALRHGSVMGVAMVIRSIEKKKKKGWLVEKELSCINITDISCSEWEDDWKKFEEKTVSVVGNLETLKKFNGKGAENVRHAACEVN